ncbi:MAG: hypothetical protein Q9M36_15815 [Sulfurovum sp.]|nr:hypothetical protein [Sulfurovum sp.]
MTSKGIESERVSKMYFAEQSLEAFVDPVLLGESSALVNLYGTMTIVPQLALEPHSRRMSIHTGLTPQKGVSFEVGSKTLIPLNEAYTIASICILFMAIYLVEASRYGGSDHVHDEEILVLLEAYPALESSYTRNNILLKYREIDKKRAYQT